ncbi:hypothetical protein B0H13DRAFT_1934566 [Mycena leptocephala]|nr:hypothetical protein B0H13DRAFT_1934566 [Mycena leptocephala]
MNTDQIRAEMCPNPVVGRIQTTGCPNPAMPCKMQKHEHLNKPDIEHIKQARGEMEAEHPNTEEALRSKCIPPRSGSSRLVGFAPPDPTAWSGGKIAANHQVSMAPLAERRHNIPRQERQEVKPQEVDCQKMKQGQGLRGEPVHQEAEEHMDEILRTWLDDTKDRGSCLLGVYEDKDLLEKILAQRTLNGREPGSGDSLKPMDSGIRKIIITAGELRNNDRRIWGKLGKANLNPSRETA